MSEWFVRLSKLLTATYIVLNTLLADTQMLQGVGDRQEAGTGGEGGVLSL